MTWKIPRKRKSNKILTCNELKTLIHYDPLTGIFTWIKRRFGISLTKNPGSINNFGYVKIMIKGKYYGAHRLAWLYMTGDWPKHEVDHRDLDKSNNKWSNLRSSDRCGNTQNTAIRKTNTTGFKGVIFIKNRKTNPWHSQIQCNKKHYHLGCFSTPEEAHQAYLKAAKRLHKKFARIS